MRIDSVSRLFAAAVFAVLAASGAAVQAQQSDFAPGWTLDKDASRFAFQSIKNNAVVETSGFASYSGAIEPDGSARVVFDLDSIDTKIDLRNVRMRFLFFETFKHPQAIITAKIDPAIIEPLKQRRRLRIPIEYELELHGVKKTLTAETVVTLFSEQEVSVASAEPIAIATKLFNLDEGVQKLEDAAKVDIVPSGSVTFDFVFKRGAAAAPPPPQLAAATAVETTGEFSREECEGRFEILSRTGSVYFKSGSADLDGASTPLLDTVLEIAERCQSLNILVEGHTDAQGAADANQRLSEARARSVVAYLSDHGLTRSRLRAVGYGETRPVAPNDTARNRSRNRRIQFLIDS